MVMEVFASIRLHAVKLRVDAVRELGYLYLASVDCVARSLKTELGDPATGDGMDRKGDLGIQIS